MAAFFIAALVVFAIALPMLIVYIVGRVRQAHDDEATLPAYPRERRAEEIRRLRQAHEEAAPEQVTHPARRP
jgi:uncharacterized membrane protein